MNRPRSIQGGVVPLLLFIIVVLGLAFYYQSNPTKLTLLTTKFQNMFNSVKEEPSTEQACQVVKGIWEKEKGICVLPTADYGQPCHNSSECAGDCLAQLSVQETELLTKEPGQHVLKKSGTCSQWRPMLGCHPRVYNNQISRLTCQN